MSYTVAQNASFLTFASVLQKVVSFAYFAIVAYLIGVENTGSYFFAITFTTIFAVVADLGLGPILTREAAKYPEQSEKYFNTVFWAKILFGVFAYVLVVVFANALSYAPELKKLIYLSGVTMFFDNIQGGFYSIFRAKKNLIYESVAIVLSQTLTLIIGTTALLLKAPLVWLIAAYAIPSGLLNIYAAYFVRRVYGYNFNFAVDKLVFRQFFIMAIPFAVAGILGRLYAYSDSLIMSKMLNAKYLGWWSVPYKITFAFQFIPMALSASVYPAMSSFSVSEPERVGDLFVKAWKYLFVAVFPLSLGLMAVAEPVITTFFGDSYAPSIPVLRILLVSLIFSYLSIISGSLLNAVNRQRIQTSLVATVLVLNVLMNLYLIPRFNIIGAAYAALISNFILWILGFYFVNRTVRLQNFALFKAGYQTFIPAILMAGLVYFLTFKLTYFITIPVGVVLYGGLLFLSGMVDKITVLTFYQKIRIKKA